MHILTPRHLPPIRAASAPGHPHPLSGPCLGAWPVRALELFSHRLYSNLKSPSAFPLTDAGCAQPNTRHWPGPRTQGGFLPAPPAPSAQQPGPSLPEPGLRAAGLAFPQRAWFSAARGVRLPWREMEGHSVAAGTTHRTACLCGWEVGFYREKGGPQGEGIWAPCRLVKGKRKTGGQVPTGRPQGGSGTSELLHVGPSC